MAVLESFNYQPMNFISGISDDLPWTECKENHALLNCPQVFFEDGEPWLAANMFALDALERGSRNETVVSAMNHIRDYANWLEDEGISWLHFPVKKRHRCLYRYRGSLIERRDNGLLSPSTASARMNAVVRFYRWAQANNWLDGKGLWQDKISVIRSETAFGLARSLAVVSSDLSIPNRKRPGSFLEDGLLPISDTARKTLLNYLKDSAPIEIYLMFIIGFFTGARIETIRTLRLSSLESFLDDPTVPGLKRVPVGPPTKVKTKYDVSGHLLFPVSIIEILRKYATSARRLHRQSRASKEDETLLFLTVNGAKYKENSFSSIISKLRQRLVKEGYSEFKRLKFHQSRATFGTNLMRMCIDLLPSTEAAIVFVRDAMLHKNESTTWKYITFVENEPLKEKISDEFFSFFSGQAESSNTIIDELTYG